jgi:cytochrome c oxidase subunit II
LTRNDIFHVAGGALAVLAGLLATASPRARAEDGPRVIVITAKRFEFSPKEITLKKGETVKLQLKSEDVTHGFFLRPLGIDKDIPAGETAEVTVTPQEVGRYRAICDHFCGAGHGGMKMTIVVEEATGATPPGSGQGGAQGPGTAGRSGEDRSPAAGGHPD